MFDIGGGELLLIILAILVLFGPEKIPEIARTFGKGMDKVRKAQAELQSQLSEIENTVKKAADTENPKPKPYINKENDADPYHIYDPINDEYKPAEQAPPLDSVEAGFSPVSPNEKRETQKPSNE